MIGWSKMNLAGFFPGSLGCRGGGHAQPACVGDSRDVRPSGRLRHTIGDTPTVLRYSSCHTMCIGQDVECPWRFVPGVRSFFPSGRFLLPWNFTASAWAVSWR